MELQQHNIMETFPDFFVGGGGGGGEKKDIDVVAHGRGMLAI